MDVENCRRLGFRQCFARALQGTFRQSIQPRASSIDEPPKLTSFCLITYDGNRMNPTFHPDVLIQFPLFDDLWSPKNRLSSLNRAASLRQLRTITSKPERHVRLVGPSSLRRMFSAQLMCPQYGLVMNLGLASCVYCEMRDRGE